MRQVRAINRERGASLLEYTLLIGLVAVVAVASAQSLGKGMELTLCNATALIDGGQSGTSENPCLIASEQ